MRGWGCLELVLLGAVSASLLGAGCRGDGGPDARLPPSVVRVSPLSVSHPDAWRLFDRSTNSSFTVSGRPITLELGHAAELVAIKVFGPAPVSVDLRGRSGASLGFEPIDLTNAAAGWNVFSSGALTATDHVEIILSPMVAGTQIPELELWAMETEDEHVGVSASADLVAFAATTESDELAPGNCANFEVAIPRPPTQFRRARLDYDAAGLFRAFSIARSINGLPPQGGAWLAGGDATTRSFSERIDPTILREGPNEIRLCSPDDATRTISIRDLKIIGELDRGTRGASAISIEASGQDTSRALDEELATSIEVAAGERIEIELERLTAPDLLVARGAADAEVAIDCVDLDGSARTLAGERGTSDDGLTVRLGGQAHACRRLAVTFDRAVTVSEFEVVGSGVGDPVDWPQVVISSEREHFGDVAWVGGYVAHPPATVGAIRVDVAGAAAATMTGAFGSIVRRTHDAAGPWSVTVAATVPDGSSPSLEVVLDADHASQLAAAKTSVSASQAAATLASAAKSRFGEEGDAVAGRAATAAPLKLRLGTRVGLDVPAGAVRRPTNVTARHLGADVLPPLDPGMINVTAPKGRGYEFLPHGQRFARPIEVIAHRPRISKPSHAGGGPDAMAKGAAREARVAELIGGSVSRQSIKTRFGSSDIDVIGPAGELIAVGGPAKAYNLSKLGSQLKVLQEAAAQRGVAAKAAFERGTPQTAIDLATKKLGVDNIIIF